MTISLEEILKSAIQAETAKITVSIPASVVAYDHATQTCSARPVVADRFSDGSQAKPPTITSVPVAFPSASGYSITWPLSVGDPVLLVFAHRSIDEWILTGEIDNDAADPRRFDGSDALAIPGGNSPATPITSTGLDTGSMVVQASEIRLGSSAASAFVALASLVETESAARRAWEITHIHTDPTSGFTGPPTVAPPTLGSLASTKVKAE